MKLVVASDEKLHWRFKKKNGKWVEIGIKAAKVVADKKVDQGVLFCWSGTGITMVANRIKGARAALCWTPQIAKLARKWDNANILVMALVDHTNKEALGILDVWFNTEFDEEGLNEACKLDKTS